MVEKNEEEIKKIFKDLSPENQEVLNLLAKGMQIAENNGKEVK